MSLNDNDVVIVAAKRTPHGVLLGQLSSLTAPELAAVAHHSALEQSGVDHKQLDEVISGCVLQAGIGQAPARQAAIKAGIPYDVPATTINKMCGSGMKAIMLAHDLIKAGSAKTILASGMESMSNAPYLLRKARAGYRLGHGECYDHLILDGLEDTYHPGKLMGYFAEKTAQQLKFTREQQDEFAARSMTRALEAQQQGWFHDEIAPVSIQTAKTSTIITKDEPPDPEKLKKIPLLNPVFDAEGTVTAANSSSITDGAASLILMSATEAQRQHITPLARIVAHASHAQEPAWFTTAPAAAIRNVLNLAGWQSHQVDLFEINEAFAVVALAAISDLELDIARVNVHGGACALGHPIGASGARILVTLLYALMQRDQTHGVAALCIGGGEATALAIEVL